MFGRPHNPQYPRERLPLEGPRAGNPQGLCDAHLGRVLRGPFPTARCLPESEGCDGEGELPVLRVPRDDDATGGPRVPRPRATRRTGLVDPVRPEQIPRTRTGRRGPRASGRAIRVRRRRRGERRVRRAAAVRVALPVRDVAAPESTRTGIRDALRCGPCGTHGDSERRPRSHGSDARRSVLQLLHSRGPGPEPEGTFHWHLEITPRLTEIAGFERGTGFYINPVVPEDAAAILKGEIRWAAARPSAT